MSVNILQYQTFPFFHSPFHHLMAGFIRCSMVFTLRHEDNHRARANLHMCPGTPLWWHTWLTSCWDLFPSSHYCHATTMLCYAMLYYVASGMSDSVRPHRRQPTRLRHPWDSPGKNTGVGCHFLHQCMKVKSESEVAQLYH